MFFNDKHGPHFHAVYGNYDAIINIADGEIMAGSLPPRARKLVLEWWKAHRAELEENWNRARNQQPLKPIKPLE